MSTENVSVEPSDETKQSSERRRSTTVIMTANVVAMPVESSEGGVRRNGSVRRRLSKQNATIEEPMSLLSVSDPPSSEDAVPRIEEHPEEEDGTKLRPPETIQKKSWTSAKSMSRESNGTEYSDRSGTDLRNFVHATIHKSEEDRKQLLEFEKELKNLILDDGVQSRKFELPSSYHRMLLHRCAAWFGLDHNVTNKQTDIVVNKSERTKIPDETFSDYIKHDNYAEDGSFKRQRGSRKDLHHMESFGDPNSQFGSQASLNHDILMMRRAQSFDVASVAGPPVLQPQQPVRGHPVRQLSLNCAQPIVAAPLSQGHQWAPQRSFDCSNQSYLCTTKHPMMRKAESFGGMGMSSHGCYEPMVCQTPPSVMVHHHHHHAHGQPTYTGYQVFDEVSMPSPNYPEQGMCSPGGTYYEYVPPQQYTRPVRYVQRPPSAGVPYVYGLPPQQYVPYPQMMNPEVRVDTFPQVSQFVPPPSDQQGYSSSHQAETASSFIKASIDGGYGSMNQEQDSGSNPDKADE